jgi:16S rRNA (uracil1498-N3)-methyltransferase
MRIPRIYTPQQLDSGLTITLEEQASTHLARVLRCQTGDKLRVFNGQGCEFMACISATGKKAVDIVLAEKLADNSLSPLLTHIAVGVSKGEKMDFIVQKCTELGVTAIYPIITERSDVRMTEERWQKKVERWQDIAISACEQSGLNSVPSIHTVLTYMQWLELPSAEKRCLFHPDGDSTFSALPVSNQISMAFGSEGGFSDNEINMARKAGCYIARLGPRILRAETAPVAALAIAQAQWGDLLK